MPTDPTGDCFVSYKRERADDAGTLIRALWDHGIPTWQDIRDLGHGYTEQQIRDILDPRTGRASAVLLYITPEVVHSDIIKTVEARLGHDRSERDPAFLFLPIVAGGLSYDDGAAIFAGHLGLGDLRNPLIFD